MLPEHRTRTLGLARWRNIHASTRNTGPSRSNAAPAGRRLLPNRERKETGYHVGQDNEPMTPAPFAPIQR